MDMTLSKEGVNRFEIENELHEYESWQLIGFASFGLAVILPLPKPIPFSHLSLQELGRGAEVNGHASF